MLSPPVFPEDKAAAAAAAQQQRSTMTTTQTPVSLPPPSVCMSPHLPPTTNWLSVTNFTSPSMSPLVGGSSSWGLGCYGKLPYHLSSISSPIPSPQSDRLRPTWDEETSSSIAGGSPAGGAAAAAVGTDTSFTAVTHRSSRQRLQWENDGNWLAAAGASPADGGYRCCFGSDQLTASAVQDSSNANGALLLPSLTLAPSAFSTMDFGSTLPSSTRGGLRPSCSSGFLPSQQQQQHYGNHSGGQGEDWLYSFVDKLRRSSISTTNSPSSTAFHAPASGLPSPFGPAAAAAPSGEATTACGSLFCSLFPPLKHQQQRGRQQTQRDENNNGDHSTRSQNDTVRGGSSRDHPRLSDSNFMCQPPPDTLRGSETSARADVVEAALRETISAAAAVAAIASGGNTPMTPTTTASTNSGYGPHHHRQQHDDLFRRSDSCTSSSCYPHSAAAAVPCTPPGLLPPPHKRAAATGVAQQPLPSERPPDFPALSYAPLVTRNDGFQHDGGLYAGHSVGSSAAACGSEGPLTSLMPLPSVPPLTQLGYNVPVKLFVNRVPKWMGDESLAKVFEPYGCVLECNILRNSFGPKGCAFVKYNSIVEAHQAILNLHGKHVLNKDAGPMQIKYADGELERLGISLDAQPGGESVKVFVGCLPRRCTEQHLMDTFQEFGYVDEVFVLRDAQKQPKCSAFVTFTRMDAALRAIKALDKKCMLPNAKRPLEVRLAESKVSRLLSRDKQNGDALTAQHQQVDCYAESGDQREYPPQQQLQSSGCLATAALEGEGNYNGGDVAVYAP